MHATVYLENEEYIALCDLLKLAGLAESGGQAKSVIAEGLVLRNGAVETRKTAKIRGGEVIEFDGAVLEVRDGCTPTANNEAALPPEPVPPEDWECCGSECGDACTFEIYRREKAEYEALKRQVQADAPSEP